MNCDLNKTTVVRAIDQLEKMGLVRREPGPEDRRVNYVFLTSKGRTKGESFLEKVKELEKTVFFRVLRDDGQSKLRDMLMMNLLYAAIGFRHDEVRKSS